MLPFPAGSMRERILAHDNEAGRYDPTREEWLELVPSGILAMVARALYRDALIAPRSD